MDRLGFHLVKPLDEIWLVILPRAGAGDRGSCPTVMTYFSISARRREYFP